MSARTKKPTAAKAKKPARSGVGAFLNGDTSEILDMVYPDREIPAMVKRAIDDAVATDDPGEKRRGFCIARTMLDHQIAILDGNGAPLAMPPRGDTSELAVAQRIAVVAWAQFWNAEDDTLTAEDFLVSLGKMLLAAAKPSKPEGRANG